ncbi:hypothetical protein BACCAP_02807 [Pseudoflavonifractor capillosus ATCC 29799]|uniref:Uncharacterized protein n=1 Tax=Pseudoflavonifractor capillosus ATCC 29799 TaxID=411467 RepID=A6NX62_9FIRM|nr:hypothetical protein BACCAP_02807 [Pseudoflavonifractor capillosus ATCC 29799]
MAPCGPGSPAGPVGPGTGHTVTVDQGQNGRLEFGLPEK